MTKNRRPQVEEFEARTLLSGGLSAVGIPEVHLLAGHRYTGPVVTFHDSRLTSWDGNVTVTINWGDGSRSEQTTDIRSLGHGEFQVWGTHAYNSPRSTPYDMTVEVRERNGSSALSSSLFQIVNPAVSLQLAAGTYTHGRPISFKISASQTPNNQPPTAYLMEYQAPGETTWHVISRGTWHGTSPSHGDFLLSGTITPPRAGRFLVRALATVGGVEYPSHSLTITVR
jgi:hypothetical protein